VLSSSPSGAGNYMQQQSGMQQLQPGSLHMGMSAPAAPGQAGMPPLSPVRQQQQQQAAAAAAAGSSAGSAGGQARGTFRSNSSGGGMHRALSCAALESIDETSVFRLQAMQAEGDASGHLAARGHSLPGSLGALPPAHMQGAPVSASGTYLTQQQQQQGQQTPGGMVPTGGGFGGGGGLPPMSTALPVPQDHHQQQQYGQAPAMHSSFGGPSASAMHLAQTGSAPPTSSGMYGMGGMGPPGAAGASSAAAAAAAFDAMSAGDDKWNVLGQAAVPDSPLGNVQIGGEDLDVTMAFLTDHSPRCVYGGWNGVHWLQRQRQ
jgi:hypothetical protein